MTTSSKEHAGLERRLLAALFGLMASRNDFGEMEKERSGASAPLV